MLILCVVHVEKCFHYSFHIIGLSVKAMTFNNRSLNKNTFLIF